MEALSYILAKFWGWYLICFFLILSTNPNRILQIIKNLKDEKFALLTAFLAIIIGLINTILHSIWVADWRIIISIIGWVAIGIGISLFVFPKKTVSWFELINIKFVQVFYVLLFFVGLFLLNMGYGFIIF